jgi:excisionase family DNA binding protein
MELLSTQQVAEETGLSLRAIQDLIAKGHLPAMQVGRAYVVLRKDVAKVAKRPGRGAPKGKK